MPSAAPWSKIAYIAGNKVHAPTPAPLNKPQSYQGANIDSIYMHIAILYAFMACP